MDIRQESTSLFATQGGGYAVYEGGRYVWHSDIPDFVNAQLGDPIPEQWGVVAVNQAARDDVEDDLMRCTQCGDRNCLGLCEAEYTVMATSYPGEEFPAGTGEYTVLDH